MIAALGQDHRPAAGFEAHQHVVEDAIIALLVLRESGIERGDLHGRLALEVGREPEAGLANRDLVAEGARGGLRLGIDAIAHRAALHEDDRMVAVLARDRRGEPQHVSRLRPPRDELEADGREMVALVDDQVTVVADEIAHLAVAHEALDQRDVDPPRRLALAATDGADAGILHR